MVELVRPLMIPRHYAYCCTQLVSLFMTRYRLSILAFGRSGLSQAAVQQLLLDSGTRRSQQPCRLLTAPQRWSKKP